MRLVPLHGVRIGLAAILIAFLGHTRADPDLWGHVLFGGEIVTSGRIPAFDSFSFMSDRPWINHEWLAECAMFASYALGGGAGLVLLKVMLIATMLAGIAVSLRAKGVGGTDLDLLLALVLVGTFTQANHVRPQVFSLAMFAWLLTALTTFPTTSRRSLAAIPLLMAVWVNVHGGWIVGGGILALWTVCTIVSTSERAEGMRLLGAGVVALAATLLNPYGWNLWRFLWDTVGFGRADITEWQPVFRVGTAFVLIWSLVASAAIAAIVSAARSGRLVTRVVAVVVALGLGSFWVNRLMAFFAIATITLLGPELAALRQRRRAPDAAAAVPPSRYAVAVVLLAASVMIGASAIISAQNVSCVRMDSPTLPEADVAPLIRVMDLQGRLVVWFDWGEYAIWHLGSSFKVSTDGRRETVYSSETLQQHLLFYFVPSARTAFLAQARPDYIWLPQHLPVVQALQSDGWVPLFSGPKSILLGKTGQAVHYRPPTIAKRCFPGP
jgi:hypothetical protein